MDLTVTEHRIEPFQTFRGFGKDGDSADRPVKPMRNPHENVAGLCVALRDERLQCLAQRLVARLVALDNFPHPLVEHQQVIVLKKNPASQVAGFLF